MGKGKLKIVYDKVCDIAADFPIQEGDKQKLCQIAALELWYLIYYAIIALRNFQLEGPVEKEINWYNNPHVGMHLSVAIDWEGLISKSKILIDESGAHAKMMLQDLVGMAEVLEDSFSKDDRLFVFRLLCRDVALLKGGDLFLPKYLLMSRLEDMSQKEWEKVVAEKLQGIKPLTFSLSDLITADWSEKNKVNGSLIIEVGPLMVNFVNKEAYYLGRVVLEFNGVQPALWSKKKRLEFCDTLLKAVEAQILEGEKFGFEMSSSLEPARSMLIYEKSAGKFGFEISSSLETTQERTTSELSYPIVNMDRTTAQDILPMFLNKGIFKNYNTLSSRDEIIDSEKKSLNKTELTFQEERGALTRVGEYKSGGHVIRDYGRYAIGFPSKLYIDYVEKTEDELKHELLTPTLFPDMNRNIEEALKKIKLYKIAHKLAFAILAEAHSQKRLKELVIPKKRLVELLGYTADNKQIYQDIRDALTSLRWLEYKLWDYAYTAKEKKYTKEKSTSIGNFIYNLREDAKTYTLWLNELFVGCVQYLFEDKQRSKKERRELFDRGYFTYPTRILPLTKDYSDSAYFLTQFLVREKGNQKLKEPGYKVVAYRVERFIEEANLNYKEKGKRYSKFIEALKEVEIIEKTKPTIPELENLKPTKGLTQMLYVWVKDSTRKLDRDIEDRLRAKK